MFNVSKLRSKRFLSLLFVIFAAFLFIFPHISIPQNVNASLGFCKALGPGLQSQASGVDSSSIVASDAANRKWTIQELFSNSLDFTSYDGESPSESDDQSAWLYDTGKDRGKGTPGWTDSDVQKKLQGARSTDKCLVDTIGLTTWIPNLIIMLASKIVGFGNLIVSALFNPNFICSDPANPQGACINLIATIGGTSDNGNGGLIGTLFNSVYQPLIALAFICTALWLMYTGLIKRELRMSLSGIIWAIAIFFIGVISMSHPTMLASAPQTINSTIGSCIVGAMNGQSCLNGSITAPSTLVGEECRSNGSTKGSEGAAMAVNGMSCTLWKSFVLDPWARAEFGRGYNDLYIADTPKGGNLWSGAPKNASNLCIHLNSSGSADSFKGSVVKLNGGTPICNLALYQLYLRSGVVDTLSNSKPSSKTYYDKRWYNIAVPATQDDTMWAAWNGDLSQSMTRFVRAFTGLIIATITIISLAVFSFWGLMYSFAGTLLMTFSPLFFLVAVVPGKGKRIFLGWLESVVSSTLKYMASALFVIVALAMYAGILNNTDNYASAFIGIIIMVGVMFTYRKEIINLLGMANLGGERLSNAVGEKLHDKADKMKELGAIGAGSGFGAVAAGGSFKAGVGEGISRRLRRDNTFVGGFARQQYLTKRKMNNPNDPNMPEGSDPTNPNTCPICGGPLDENGHCINHPEHTPQKNDPNKKDDNNNKKNGKNANDNPDPNAGPSELNDSRCPICGSVLVNGLCPHRNRPDHKFNKKSNEDEATKTPKNTQPQNNNKQDTDLNEKVSPKNNSNDANGSNNNSDVGGEIGICPICGSRLINGICPNHNRPDHKGKGSTKNSSNDANGSNNNSDVGGLNSQPNNGFNGEIETCPICGSRLINGICPNHNRPDHTGKDSTKKNDDKSNDKFTQLPPLNNQNNNSNNEDTSGNTLPKNNLRNIRELNTDNNNIEPTYPDKNDNSQQPVNNLNQDKPIYPKPNVNNGQNGSTPNGSSSRPIDNLNRNKPIYPKPNVNNGQNGSTSNGNSSRPVDNLNRNSVKPSYPKPNANNGQNGSFSKTRPSINSSNNTPSYSNPRSNPKMKSNFEKPNNNSKHSSFWDFGNKKVNSTFDNNPIKPQGFTNNQGGNDTNLKLPKLNRK